MPVSVLLLNVWLQQLLGMRPEALLELLRELEPKLPDSHFLPFLQAVDEGARRRWPSKSVASS